VLDRHGATEAIFMALRVLIADDHAVIRGALCMLLEDTLGATEVVQAATLQEAREILASDNAFDLLIIDLIMPGVENVGSIAALSDIAPAARIVVISAAASHANVMATLAARLSGFLPKSLSAAQITVALNDVLAGRIYVPAMPAIRADGALPVEQVKWPANMRGLSCRQKEVAEQLTSGQSSKQIARVLGISVGTIKVHLSAIYRAAGVGTRAQLIVLLNAHNRNLNGESQSRPARKIVEIDPFAAIRNIRSMLAKAV
jgi:DNA-binding NarL/FixJ family response regulator